MKQKDPLYRKVNSKARGCDQHKTPDSSWKRGSKHGMPKTMKSGIQHGLDYTPLFRFLLSRVGQEWDKVYSEIKPRILNDDPIWYMVKNNPNYQSIFRYGESTYFNQLFVDENGILQKIGNDIKIEHLYPTCQCCTHTFNGIPFIQKYDPTKSLLNLNVKR